MPGQDALDLDTIRLPEWQSVKPVTSRKPPRHRPGERFLKGPIPWAWLERAAGLSGKALAVGLLLWQKAGWTKCRTVGFCLNQGVALGIGRDTTRRGLRALEAAGLVTVGTAPGRGLAVTLRESTNQV